jgi:hypothetical protein
MGREEREAELIRLQRRLESWRNLTGPKWMLRYKAQTIKELMDEITKLGGKV